MIAVRLPLEEVGREKESHAGLSHKQLDRGTCEAPGQGADIPDGQTHQPIIKLESSWKGNFVRETFPATEQGLRREWHDGRTDALTDIYKGYRVAFMQ